ncbi:thioredoxin-like protein [Trametes elegans]|nr:thioredoxin-like protein [Trametes elegans]
MSQDKQLTFYTSPYSPYCHRVHIALEEAKVKAATCEIDLKPGCKPAWFTKVSPTGTVPAFTYGGSPAAFEQPAAEALKLSESIVLIEFLADVFPDSGLRPRDAELRARARLFITLSHDTLHHAFRGFFFRGERIDTILPALEAFQALLAPSGFAVGPWSMADAVVAPMIVRFMRLARHEIGKYPMGEGKRLLRALGEPKFARLMQYYQHLWDRPSVRDTWDEVCSSPAPSRTDGLTRLPAGSQHVNVKMWRIHPNVTRNTSTGGY